MLRRLRDALETFLQLRRRHAAFRRWQAGHPGGTYGQFYAEGAVARIAQGVEQGAILPKTLGGDVDAAALRRRAASLRDYLVWLGCRPEHLLVDFGCGSLWIGEGLIAHLLPGRYIGLDVIEHFYREGLQRLGSALVMEREPELALISPATLEQVRNRRPDFVISIAVLRHVRPQELTEHFRQLTSLCAPATRLIIGHEPSTWTRVIGFQSLSHSRTSIVAALAPLGYEPRFEPPAGAPPCRVSVFEIVPAGLRESPARP